MRRRILTMVFNLFRGTKLGKIPLVSKFLPRFQGLVYRVDGRMLKGLVGPDGSLLYYPEDYEKNVKQTFCKLLREGNVVVDIGASIGYYTLLAAKRIGNGLVYSFEPNLFRYRMLVENVKANGWKNVRSYSLKVSDYNGVGTTSLDSMLDDANLVKIDVEGDELRVLRGMRNILAKGNVKVICEFHPSRYPTRDLCNFLRAYRYRIYLIGDKITPVDFIGKKREHYLFVSESSRDFAVG